MLDYHLHLWEHGPRSLDSTIEQVAQYCEKAKMAGVSEIALTEHFYRFNQADVLAGFWNDDPNPVLAQEMAKKWTEEQGGDLDRYVEVVLAAKKAGLPVVLGLEVDHYAGRMDKIAEILKGYPFDVLLGSVHWIGAWGFDNLSVPAFAAEWDSRSIESIWDSYTLALEELADSRVCDVLAHPDLCGITGRMPEVPDEFYDRMAEAAAASGMAAELNAAGWRKPVGRAYPAPPLLSRFAECNVPITTASDAHSQDRVAERGDDLCKLLTSAGYDHLAAFKDRRRHMVPIEMVPIEMGPIESPQMIGDDNG